MSNGRFVKGKSGNPSGAPKLTPEQKADNLAALAIIIGGRKKAAEYLIRVIEDPETSPKDGIAAAKEILRGVEPSRLEITGAEDGPMRLDISSLSPDAKREIMDAYDAKLNE